jgi:hypothetical protein
MVQILLCTLAAFAMALLAFIPYARTIIGLPARG